MRLGPGLLAISLGSLVSAAAAAVGVAGSADAPVVLLGTTEDEPLTGRIAAELRALGIGIEIRVVAGDERGVDLEVESALREGARAAVRVDAQAGRTEVSIADPVTRRVAIKQVLEGAPTAALAPVLAVRTVEFVRATLLGPKVRGAPTGNDEVNTRQREAGSDAGEIATSAPPAPAESPVAPPLATLGLAVEAGPIVTPGALPRGVTAGIVARIGFYPRVGLEIMGFAPLTVAHLDDPQSPARASTWLAGAGLFARQPLGAHAGIELGAGLLAAIQETTTVIAKEHAAEFVGGTDWWWGASVYARLGADVALTRALALRLDLLGGGTFQKNDIDFLDGPSRTVWGRTFAAAFAGVEARWF